MNYEAETAAYESADCKSNLVSILKTSGTYVLSEIPEGFRMVYTRTSLKVRVIQARELDHWNGVLTALPVCEGFRSKLGDDVEMINMKCLNALGEYRVKPQSTWSEDILVEDSTFSLTGLVFGQFPAIKVYEDNQPMGAAAPMKTLGDFQEGEPYFPGIYSFSSIANNHYGLSSQLAGAWETCHNSSLVTLTFSGSSWTQTAKVGLAEDCSGSPAYTMSFSGTYSVPGGLDYVEGGYKINYSNTGITYTVHSAAALDLFNGTAGSTAFCSGYTFVLNAETSIMGRSCKPRPQDDGAYATVSSMMLYDIILVRDHEITDSRFTAEGQGSSDASRPYFFNGDMVYKKL